MIAGMDTDALTLFALVPLLLGLVGVALTMFLLWLVIRSAVLSALLKFEAMGRQIDKQLG